MINISRVMHSISDFKRNTPDFLEQLKITGDPVVLTMNGRAKVVVQDAESYQNLLDRLERARNVLAVSEELADVKQDKTMSLESFDRKMRQKFPRRPQKVIGYKVKPTLHALTDAKRRFGGL
jgi:prevent-host-death family protein